MPTGNKWKILDLQESGTAGYFSINLQFHGRNADSVLPIFFFLREPENLDLYMKGSQGISKLKELTNNTR